MRPHGRIRTTGQRALSNCRLLAMHYDMRPDRLGWTLFDVTTGRPVVWEDVPLTGVALDAAHELLVLLHRTAASGREKRVRPASPTRVRARLARDAADLNDSPGASGDVPPPGYYRPQRESPRCR